MNSWRWAAGSTATELYWKKRSRLCCRLRPTSRRFWLQAVTSWLAARSCLLSTKPLAAPPDGHGQEITKRFWLDISELMSKRRAGVLSREIVGRAQSYWKNTTRLI